MSAPYHRGVDLHHEVVANGDADKTLALTHGIYGSGANWRTIARKLVERRPEWAVALVDLRHHGRSRGGEPPDTLDACAADFHATCARISPAVVAIGGHSFGGKVALAARPRFAELAQTWVFDSSPSARPGAMTDGNTVVAILELMERLPRAWPTRDAFVNAITAAGIAQGIAQWLAMNLTGDAGGFTLRLDLPAIRAMLVDYFARDVWDAVLAPRPGEIEFVVADRSDVVSDEDRAKLATMPAHVHVDLIDAGHWLNVEAPAAIVELLARRL
jgi:pimeloyl-ACP methyl ester carboxylesterase